MIFYFGKRLYGHVDEQGRASIATYFFHVYFVPLVPLGSHLVLQGAGNGYQSIPLGFHLRSVLAGYGRGLGPVVTVALFFAAYNELRDGSDDAAALRAVLLAMGALVGVILAYVWLGRLSAEQRAQRRVYQRSAGAPIDVALLSEARDGLAETLRAEIAERVRGLSVSDYRFAGDPAEAWRSVAVDPSVTDTDLIGASLTLARVEWSRASGAARASLAETHRRIWARLRAARPELLREAAKHAVWRTRIGAALGALLTVAGGVFLGSELARRAQRELEDLPSWMGRPGAAATGATALSRDQPVFVMTRRYPWSAVGPRPAEIAALNADGSVRVTYLRSTSHDTVPRDKVRLVDKP